MKTKWLDLVGQAFDASTAFIDSNYRPDWDYSLKAFRNEHAAGSKYLSPEYAARSRIFPPHTRSVIRKNEAAAHAALFMNMEMVNLTPGNPDNLQSVAGTAAMKEVLEYRLSKSIPSFEICMGGVQDAQVQGAVVSYQYWEYDVRNGRKIKDKPCIELRPIENIRIDGGASWLDPIESSPYFCDIIPMYVCDVRAMMNQKDRKTGEPPWKKLKDEEILKARPDILDTTRKARFGKQEDPHLEEKEIREFDVVWVMRWFMRDAEGIDHTFYTLGTEALLSDPKPIEEVYFHGKRPYVMGYAVLETHKALKTSVPMLVKPLQQESAEIRNQRLDNVKFVLNKRWLVARGRQVDVNSLVRNVPGGVTLVTDPKTDVQESNWPDVTSSSYVEQDRLKSDFDELVGNFSPSTKVANNAVNDTLGGSKMAAQGAGLMTDYLLRTIIETWWEKVLRQLVLLEQYYETDEVVLGICAEKARLFPRFGLSRITDDLLMQEVNVTVNVGIGAANPSERFQKFMVATNAAAQLRINPPPGLNISEATKEIMALAGYRDGARFFDDRQDPRLAQAQQMIQQLQGALEGKQLELRASAQIEVAKLQSNERVKAAQLQVDNTRIQGDLAVRQAELVIESQRLELDKLQFQLEAEIAARDAGAKDQENTLRLAELHSTVEQAQAKLEGERQKLVGLAVKIAHETEQAKIDLQKAEKELANEGKISGVADQMSKSMQSVTQEIENIKGGIAESSGDIQKQVENLRQGLALVAGAVSQPKKKMQRVTMKKNPEGKRVGVSIEFDSGEREEIALG